MQTVIGVNPDVLKRIVTTALESNYSAMKVDSSYRVELDETVFRLRVGRQLIDELSDGITRSIWEAMLRNATATVVGIDLSKQPPTITNQRRLIFEENLNNYSNPHGVGDVI